MSWDSGIRNLLRRPTPSSTTTASPSASASKPATNTTANPVAQADAFDTSTPKAGPNLTGEAKVSPDGTTTLSGSASADGASVNGSVTAGPNGVSADVNGSVEAKGLKIHFGTQISSTSNAESKDGVTTVTAEGSMSVNLGGEVDLKAGGFGADYTEGVRTKYQVRMSDADYAQVQAGQAQLPDPYNADSMPVGSSVLMNSTDFQDTGFEASYRQLKLETNVSEEQGVSVAVEKTGPTTVRVTAGPTEAVENSFKLGLSLGPASASIGNTTRLDQFTLKTAEFDISTPEGRAAYNTFLATGQLPQQNGTGVANVATVEKLKYDSTTSAGISLGPLSGSVDLANSNMNVVKTTYPDGSSDQVTDVKLHSGTPVHLEQHFNADGTEDPSKTKISMFMVGADGGAEEEFAAAYGVDQHDFDKDNDIYLSFTPDQAMQLAQRARDYMAQWERETGHKWSEQSHLQDDNLIAALANAKNPTDVARALTESYGGPNWMGSAFQKMAIVGDQSVPLPGSIEARNRNG